MDLRVQSNLFSLLITGSLWFGWLRVADVIVVCDVIRGTAERIAVGGVFPSDSVFLHQLSLPGLAHSYAKVQEVCYALLIFPMSR